MAPYNGDKNPTIEYIESEEIDREISPPKFNIITYPADFTLEILYNKLDKGEIQAPNFQRNFVWNQNQSSKLIESFLLHLPVPAVFLYNEHKTQNYLILDGQQRLKTIQYYIDGIFNPENPNCNRPFCLTGLAKDSKYYNLAYSDLQEVDRQFLSDSILRAYIVRQLATEDDLSKYHIFERLNAGGTNLQNQEIRNCVYFGRFSEALDQMNSGSKWRSIFGTNKPDKRKRDVELILRFLALRDYSDYSPSMKDYLSKFMKQHQNADWGQLKQFRSVFKQTCSSVIMHLGTKPFHRRSRQGSKLNAALLDAVMVAFSNQAECIPRDIGSRFEELLNDKNFIESIRLHTTDRKAVTSRFSLAKKILFSK